MATRGAGVEITNPPLTVSMGALPNNSTSWVLQKDPTLGQIINTTIRCLTGLVTFLNDYRIGILKNLPLFRIDGSIAGYLGYQKVGDGTVDAYGLSADYVRGLRAEVKGSPKTANFTVGDLDATFFPVDCTGGNVTATLPPIASSLDRILVFMKIDASGNTLTVSGDANINGAGSLVTGVQYTRYMLIGGVEWYNIT